MPTMQKYAYYAEIMHIMLNTIIILHMLPSMLKMYNMRTLMHNMIIMLNLTISMCNNLVMPTYA